jgi:hypothetical protein
MERKECVKKKKALKKSLGAGRIQAKSGKSFVNLSPLL